MRPKTALSKPNSKTLKLRIKTERNEMTVKCRKNGKLFNFHMTGNEKKEVDQGRKTKKDKDDQDDEGGDSPMR